MREPISKKLRFEILKRDSFTCQYCGSKPPGVVLHIDHIIPVAKGGLTVIENLVTSCEPCNSGKRDKPLKDLDFDRVNQSTDEIHDKAAKIVEASKLFEQQVLAVLELWATLTDNEDEESFYYSRQEDEAVRKFVKLSGVEEVMDSMRIACEKFPNGSDWYRFKYFCGVSWKKIKDKESENVR